MPSTGSSRCGCCTTLLSDKQERVHEGRLALRHHVCATAARPRMFSLTARGQAAHCREARRSRHRLYRRRMAGLQCARRGVLQARSRSSSCSTPKSRPSDRPGAPASRASHDRNLEAAPRRRDSGGRPCSARPGTCTCAKICASPRRPTWTSSHDTIAYLKRHVDEVIFDAEHFFDGFRDNPEFALACLRAAADGGRRSDRAVRYQRRPPAG